VLSIALEINI